LKNRWQWLLGVEPSTLGLCSQSGAFDLSVVMGPGKKFLTGSGQFFVARVGSGRVSHLWFGLEFGKLPLKM